MFLQDLRHAFRSLSRTLGFTSAATLSLALGIGGTVALFSLVNAVLLKSLPYPDPERLVVIREVWPKLSHLWPSLPLHAPLRTPLEEGAAFVRIARHGF